MAKNARGSALVSSLLIMTLIAIIATSMSEKIMLEIYRTRLVTSSTQLYQEAELGPLWAMSYLSDPSSSLKVVDKKSRIATMPNMKRFLSQTTKMSASLYDLQTRLNINNIEHPAWQSVFNALFMSLRPLKEEENKGLSKTITRWISPYRPGQSEDLISTHKLPAFQPLTHISELKLIPGVSLSLYEKLEPLIVALPPSTPININTVPLHILKQLSLEKKQEDLKFIDAIRRKKPIKNLDQIKSNLDRLKIQQGFLTVESEFFLVETHIEDEYLDLKVYTLLKKTKDKSQKLSVKLINQSINVR